MADRPSISLEPIGYVTTSYSVPSGLPPQASANPEATGAVEVVGAEDRSLQRPLRHERQERVALALRKPPNDQRSTDPSRASPILLDQVVGLRCWASAARVASRAVVL